MICFMYVNVWWFISIVAHTHIQILFHCHQAGRQKSEIPDPQNHNICSIE